MSELVINLMKMEGLERIYLCEREELDESSEPKDGQERDIYIISGLSKQMEVGATIAAYAYNNSNRFEVLEILERRDPKGVRSAGLHRGRRRGSLRPLPGWGSTPPSSLRRRV